MLRKLCEYKGIEIHEAEACKDHIHMLVSIPPKYSVSQSMGTGISGAGDITSAQWDEIGAQ